MLQDALIRPSNNPYSSPAILVRRNDGSWRLYIDYRELNSQTVKNRFPIPMIEDLLDELYGAQVFIVIPRSEKVEIKPPYMFPGCSNHTYNNNMINRCHVW
jgi:hypothetical protein